MFRVTIVDLNEIRILHFTLFLAMYLKFLPDT